MIVRCSPKVLLSERLAPGRCKRWQLPKTPFSRTDVPYCLYSDAACCTLCQHCKGPQSGSACRPCSYIVCMERETLLIPSGYKSKIPSTLAWPIKAQELSVALAGVPQFDLLKLNFRFYKSDRETLDWASSWITLLRVIYSRHDRGFSSSRAMDERGWHNKS